MFKNLFFFLLTHFSVGLLFTILFIPLREVGAFFFRINSIIAVILLGLAIWAQPFGEIAISFGDFSAAVKSVSLLAFIICLATSIIYIFIKSRLHIFVLSAALIFGCIGIAGYSLFVYDAELNYNLSQTIWVLNGIASSLLLGSVLGAMITGHWYLVEHKLSLTPLKNSSRIYIAAVLFRIILVVVSLVLYIKLGIIKEPVHLISGASLNSLIFLGRLVFGMIIPLIFGFMVWSSVKIRSTQSATGILYATIILVLVGEVFSRYLLYATGLML